MERTHAQNEFYLFVTNDVDCYNIYVNALTQSFRSHKCQFDYNLYFNCGLFKTLALSLYKRYAKQDWAMRLSISERNEVVKEICKSYVEENLIGSEIYRVRSIIMKNNDGTFKEVFAVDMMYGGSWWTVKGSNRIFFTCDKLVRGRNYNDVRDEWVGETEARKFCTLNSFDDYISCREEELKNELEAERRANM